MFTYEFAWEGTAMKARVNALNSSVLPIQKTKKNCYKRNAALTVTCDTLTDLHGSFHEEHPEPVIRDGNYPIVSHLSSHENILPLH
jgi:hypothetical protein